METHVLKHKHSTHYPVMKSLTPVRERTEMLYQKLKEIESDKPIMLVCIGTSGLVPASMMSGCHPDICFLYLRKDLEDSHGSSRDILPEDYCYSFDEAREKFNLVWIDDFVSSGSTLKTVINRLKSRSLSLWGVALTGNNNDYFIEEIFQSEGSQVPKVYISIETN